MTTTTTRPAGRIDMNSPTRLASAHRLLVSVEDVQEQLGWHTRALTVEDEGRLNAYAALLLCFTPKTTPSVPDPETAPSHDDLIQRLKHLSGDRLDYYEALAVARVLGMEAPSMTVREARWLFNVCRFERTKYGRELVARPREWVALEERLGIYVEFGQDYGPGLQVVGIHRTDPRAGAAPAALCTGPYTDKALEFGGDWQAIQRGFQNGFTGRDHRLAQELMFRLHEVGYHWSPRLVRDTLEIVINDHRYTIVGTTGFAHGKARLRLDRGIDLGG